MHLVYNYCPCCQLLQMVNHSNAASSLAPQHHSFSLIRIHTVFLSFYWINWDGRKLFPLSQLLASASYSVYGHREGIPLGTIKTGGKVSSFLLLSSCPHHTDTDPAITGCLIATERINAILLIACTLLQPPPNAPSAAAPISAVLKRGALSFRVVKSNYFFSDSVLCDVRIAYKLLLPV
jgi:hypothetical protein